MSEIDEACTEFSVEYQRNRDTAVMKISLAVAH